MGLFYLKGTNKKYVYENDTKRLFAVTNGLVSELMMCSPSTFRITMPMSGKRYRVNVAQIEKNMVGEPASLIVPKQQYQFNDDFQYGNESAIKNISGMNLNGAVNKLNQPDIPEIVGDTIQHQEGGYYVCLDSEIMDYESAIASATNMVKNYPNQTVFLVKAVEAYQMQLVVKKV